VSPEQVAEALTHKCAFCGALPGNECTSTTYKFGHPLRETGDRPVHHYRKDC
jgi:hypothetical protein